MNGNVFIGARGDGVQDVGRCDLEELANLNKFKVLLSRLKKRGPLKELKIFHILGGLIEGAAFVRTFKEGSDLEIKPSLRTFFSQDLGKNYGDVIIKIRNSFFGPNKQVLLRF